MAKNDVILIDNILKDRLSEGIPSSDPGEVFEYLSAEQVLKDFDLKEDEIQSGIVDGKDDGGIDSFYIFINGILLTDLASFSWPRKSCEIALYIITSKHHETFEQGVLNNQYATVSELFDLGKDNTELTGAYNSDVLYKRRIFIEAYKKTASNLSNLSVHFFYVSRGDSTIVGENIQARAEQIVEVLKGLFSNCDATYSFVGSSELLALFRKKPEYEMELKHSGIISYSQECFIVLCNLKDYYDFITDDAMKLKKYLFDSNVRDYMGLNSVNEDILESLKHNDADFWWLNNGITVLARHTVSIGNALRIQDVQIVNGLQTSQTIYDYYSKNTVTDENRSVMIKIISQDDAEIRDRIIRSTNNQTAIESKSLFATDKLQRDIEDIMKSNGLYYERRVNFYKNQDVDPSLIFDIMALGALFLGIILRVPERAANFKQKILRDPVKYDLLFNHGEPLEVWPFLAKLSRRIDKKLFDVVKRGVGNTERMVKRSRYVVGIIVLGRATGTYNYSVNKLLKLKDEDITESMIEETARFVAQKYIKEYMLSRIYVMSIISEAASLYGITNPERITKQKNIFVTTKDYYIKKQRRNSKLMISEDIVSQVKNALPKQPWPAGIIAKTAEKMHLERNIVYEAVSILIDRSDVFAQKDGVLFDKEGNIVSL